jgi:hypothetical protein
MKKDRDAILSPSENILLDKIQDLITALRNPDAIVIDIDESIEDLRQAHFILAFTFGATDLETADCPICGFLGIKLSFEIICHMGHRTLI